MIIKAIENMSQMLDVAWGASSGRKGTHDFICDSDLFDADTVSNLPSVFKCAEPTLISVHEYLNGEIYFRNPHKERPDEF